MTPYIDEGYSKFNLDWTVSAPPAHPQLEVLIHWRDHMFALGLIGYDEKHDVGYGNMSIRTDSGILITGTQTGHLAHLEPQHITLVDAYDIANNHLHCTGSLKASSESLTHAAVYECDSTAMAVIHVHNDILWSELLHSMPSTDAGVAYGTPQMAYEIHRLWESDHTLRAKKVLVMGGHQGGLISFGDTLEQAAHQLTDLL